MVSWHWMKKQDNPGGPQQDGNGDGSDGVQQHRYHPERQEDDGYYYPRRSGEDHQQQQQPDERSRLLRPQYPDPEDPVVSPYNLWSVRALSGLTLILLGISFIWWVILLVSTFVSPPMMNSRGSGFLAFSYATLTVFHLIVVGRLFFTVPLPSRANWEFALAGLLLVDACIILAVPRIRIEEGWVGIASVIWATLIAVYTVIQNKTVASGKKEEEQRLTGREETRRPLREWLALLVEMIVVGVMVAVVVLLTATLILRARDASLFAPGKKYYVSGNKYQVHLACVGSSNNEKKTKNTPSILLEGDQGPVEHSLQPFIDSVYQHGIIDRYCYWDRPGFGWSDNAPSPFSAGMAADVLAEALSKVSESEQDDGSYNDNDDNGNKTEKSFILVSAGIGGIYSRIFARRNLPNIHGMMLIDTLHEDLLGRDHYTASSGRGFLLWLRGVLSPLGFDRLAGALFRGRSREDRVAGRSAYQNDKVVKALLQENLVADSMTRREVDSTTSSGDIPRTPLVVVSSGIEVGKSEEWAKKQEDLKSITDDLVSWDVVDDAPHEVWKSDAGRQVLERGLRKLVG